MLTGKIHHTFPYIQVVLIICVILRLFLAFTSIPSGDLGKIMRWGNILEKNCPVDFFNYGAKEQLAGIYSTYWGVAIFNKWIQEVGIPLTQDFIFRIIPITSDFLNALIIYVLIKKFYRAKLATLFACLYLLNPGVFLMSSSWGQYDSFAMLFIFLSLYFIIEKRILISAFITGAGIATKPWLLLAIPFFLVYFFLENKRGNIMMNLRGIAIYLIVIFLIILAIFYPYKPYKSGSIIYHTASRYLSIDQTHNYASAFALNFWGIIRPYPASDQELFLGNTLRTYSRIAFLVFFLGILFNYLKKVKNRVSGISPDSYNLLFLSLTLAFLAMYLLLTRMHERYLFFGINLLYLSALMLPVQGRILTVLFVLAHAYNIISVQYIGSLNWGHSYTVLFSTFNLLFFFYLLNFFLRHRVNSESVNLASNNRPKS